MVQRAVISAFVFGVAFCVGVPTLWVVSEIRVERHHWLNALVGIVDGAFHLSDMEQLQVIGYVRRLLAALRIPERGEPQVLPSSVALEVSSGFYTVALNSPCEAGVVRPVRGASESDMVVSVDAWRDALLGLIVTAYPDLLPEEKLVAGTVITEILLGLGVPQRAAAFFPDTVVRAYLSSPESRSVQ